MSSVVNACVCAFPLLSSFHLLTPLSSDGVELCIIIIATFAQAMAGRAHAISIIGFLIVWRFIQGVGVGGDYPLSAVISS